MEVFYKVIKSRSEKIQSWKNTIAFNNLEGGYTASKHLLDLIEKEIDGKINFKEMVSELIELYKKDIKETSKNKL
ncbi:MAG: hypothetical protein K0R54_4292 [Clostridiaceae bacterium]|jgi:hypothetical protein|nr:hypothetical protein [Clostridiaceae bacterium]